jgi:toxin ParE1/3/4
MARVIVSPQAQADTAYIIRDFAGKAGHAVASGYAASFENLYDRLAQFPNSGAPRPAIAQHARIGVVSPYIVIYEHDEQTSDIVTIMRIVHGRQRIIGKLHLTDLPTR